MRVLSARSCAVVLVGVAGVAAPAQDAPWAWREVVRAATPDAGNGWARGDLDRFVAARLAQSALTPSPEAPRRTLIRRVTFDLLGLPPTPEEIDAFVADPAPDAYERLVDRLLASPHYGERMARAWLDLARFGESHGFEHDQIRPNAWRYREWLVDAFNADMPFDAFARAQLAGDVLDDGADAVATGFLVAGAYDSVGQSQQSAAMRAVVRQDELEDLVSVTAQTFLGISVHCARCHDHKFDPISQRDYYAFAAAFAGVHHGERDATTPRERAAWQATADQAAAELAVLRARRDAIEIPLRTRILAERGPSVAVDAPRADVEWTFDQGLDARSDERGGGLRGHAFGGARISDGALVLDGAGSYVASDPLPLASAARTLEAEVELTDLDQRGGAVISLEGPDGDVFDAIVYGEREPRRWMAGSDGFRRTRSFDGPAEDAATARVVHVAIVWHADGTIAAFRDGRPYGTPYRTDAPVRWAAGEARLLFGLRHDPVNDGKLLRGRIHRAALYARALDAEEISRTAARGTTWVPEAVLDARATPAQRLELARLRAAIATAAGRTQPLTSRRAYAVVPGEPEPVHVLERGDPRRPLSPIAPAGVASLPHADLGLAPDATDAERRARFAAWITAADQPLFARVIVNRIWQGHFGAGIVDTPSDFGANGSPPSHPELLDWLAAELVAGGFRLKPLHRAIVTSATYRQAGQSGDRAAQAAAEHIDVDARLLWRMRLRRLDAESLRDAMLGIAGRLDPAVGGPSYRDFEIRLFGATHTYLPIEPEAGALERRSLYRTWVRGGRNRLLDAFDCPDPSTTAPRRASTTTPLQALALLNDSFVMRMSDALAARVAHEAGADLDAQIARAFRLVFGRMPSPDEAALARDTARRHGLRTVARALFNSNEFLYVE